jgi:hypothetical protein
MSRIMRTEIFGRRMRRGVSLAAAAGLSLAAARIAAAQEKLTGFSTFQTGLIFENVGFGDGLTQKAGNFESTVKSAQQILVPLSLSMPIGSMWRADVTTIFGNGQATFVDEAGETATAKLSGLHDVRLRATGKLRDEGLVATFGVNIPTGKRGLDPEQVAALGVLAAPALGIYLPSVSLGPSETAGLVASRSIGDWAWAAGASYELRNSFSPVAALAAGVGDPKFDPGDAVHLSLGADRFIGENSLNISAIADIYTQDKLLASSGGIPSTVRLGPTLGVDAQYHVATHALSDLTVFASDRHRGSFSRDGASVDGSSANYLSAGIRGNRPINAGTDILGSIELWNHTGLTSDQALVTANAFMTAFTVGVNRHVGNVAWSPYARFRVGQVDTGVDKGSVTGFSIGANVLTRF